MFYSFGSRTPIGFSLVSVYLFFTSTISGSRSASGLGSMLDLRAEEWEREELHKSVGVLEAN
jgi:hypothetical protein